MASKESTDSKAYDLSVLEALKKDHDNLKKFIEVLKSEDKALKEKKNAYKNFELLLKSHSKSEEKAVYEIALKNKDLKSGAYEGYEEHTIADTLMKKLASTTEKDLWEARAQVLAELVEHHIKEEEEEFIPELEKKIKARKQEEIVENFLTLRQRSQKTASEENAGVLAEM